MLEKQPDVPQEQSEPSQIRDLFTEVLEEDLQPEVMVPHLDPERIPAVEADIAMFRSELKELFDMQRAGKSVDLDRMQYLADQIAHKELMVEFSRPGPEEE